MNFRKCHGMVYIIRRGDTLYSLSRKYQVPLVEILRANPYVDVYNLQVGDEICIPMRKMEGERPMMPGEGTAPTPSEPGMPSMPTPSVPSMPSMPTPSLPSMPSMPTPGPLPLPTPSVPVGGVIAYVIKDEDTIRDILDRFGIDLDDLLDYNDLNGMMLRPGMTIQIPVNTRR